jgi:hypothetical protein
MAILQWDTEQSRIIERLQATTKLKICCKTFNEPHLIENWIAHHGAIVGLDNLIIADNCSTDEETLAYYETVSDRVTVFQFSGSHNEIHWHPRFAPLFARIRSTCEYFAFFDVDERLVWIEDRKWRADQAILEHLGDPDSFYPTTWLINVTRSRHRFSLLDTEGRPFLRNNLRWGKPIIPSWLVASQQGIHNIQFCEHKVALTPTLNLFLLHLTQFPEQRIRANMNKLRGRGLINDRTSAEDVAGMDFASYPDRTVLRFQSEIARMEAILARQEPESEGIGYIELGAALRVTYTWAAARTLFRRCSAFAHRDHASRRRVTRHATGPACRGAVPARGGTRLS